MTLTTLALFKWFLAGVLGLLGVYIVVRLVSLALCKSYFQAKKRFQNQPKQGGA